MFVVPILNFSCITCSQGGHEEEGTKDKRSERKKNNSGAPELYGGLHGGQPWDDGIFDGISEITVIYGQWIDSIQVAYAKKDGELVNAGKHGGNGGSSKAQIKLDYPYEFLESVSGYYHEESWIYSLKFESNRDTYGPYGVEKGSPFTYRVEAGRQVVGMMGRSGQYLDAIGFYTSDAPDRDLYGRPGGRPWDDGSFNGIREITVIYGEWIDSIRVAYDNDGELVNADKHGGNGGSSIAQIELAYPDEFLVSVSGYYSTDWIRSLKFQSNRKPYGPYGVEVGRPFTIPPVEDGSKIVGLKGRSGDYIDAIGFHIKAPKKKLFPRVKDVLKKLQLAKAYDILIKITGPLQIFQCNTNYQLQV